MKLDLHKKLKAEYVTPKAPTLVATTPGKYLGKLLIASRPSPWRRVAPSKLRTILRRPVRRR
jgi:hypothetical protein